MYYSEPVPTLHMPNIPQVPLNYAISPVNSYQNFHGLPLVQSQFMNMASNTQFIQVSQQQPTHSIQTPFVPRFTNILLVDNRIIDLNSEIELNLQDIPSSTTSNIIYIFYLYNMKHKTNSLHKCSIIFSYIFQY